MHSGSSSIRVPVEINMTGTGEATRDGVRAPNQRFVPVQRGSLEHGAVVMNAATLELHDVLNTTDALVTLSTKDGRVEVSWDDVVDTVWLLVES